MSVGLRSALYLGRVGHKRLRPRQHRLRYRIFSLLVDLDELPDLGRRFRLLSVDRWNLFSVMQRDYGDHGGDVRAYVDRQTEAAGIPLDGGRVLLLTMPRILGYAFNPLSMYFCHHRDGSLRAILYEVSNTFGERHSYLIPVEGDASGTIRQTADKCFHVSPFIEMAMTYHFHVDPPGETSGETLGVTILETDADGLLLTATHRAERRDLTDGALLRAFFTHPLMTLKVIGGIHWEALRIWLKGARYQPHPAPPVEAVSVVRGHGRVERRRA